MERFLSTDGAAEFLSVSPRTLATWRYRGGGPKFARLSSRCVRYRLSDLVEFAEARVRTNTAEFSRKDEP